MSDFPADSPLVAEVIPSPNHGERVGHGRPDMIVLHYTGMPTAEGALDRLCSLDAPRVSSHYLVYEGGRIFQLVPEARRAQHAGISSWEGETDINSRSVGIEIVNPGHEFGYRDFPVLQLAAICDLCLAILARHPIPQRNVVAHSDVAPGRKQDPGEKFDWRGLAANGVGLWPQDRVQLAGAHIASVNEVRAALADIGYDVARDGAWDSQLAAVLRAFQRHWRQEAITGEADSGTLARLGAVQRMLVAG